MTFYYVYCYNHIKSNEKWNAIMSERLSWSSKRMPCFIRRISIRCSSMNQHNTNHMLVCLTTPPVYCTTDWPNQQINTFKMIPNKYDAVHLWGRLYKKNVRQKTTTMEFNLNKLQEKTNLNNLLIWQRYHQKKQ